MSNKPKNKNDSKQEILKVENLEENEYVVTASILEPPIERVTKKPKKVTVIGALLSAISIKKNDEIYAPIRPTKTISFFIFILLFSIILYFLYQVADIKLVLTLIIIFGSVAVPLSLIIFSYELCPKKDCSYYYIFLSYVFGLILYTALNGLVATLTKTIYQSTIETILVPILWGVCEFIFVAILSKMYNITDRSSTILVAVAVGMGYASAWTLLTLTSSLFVPIQGIIDSTGENYIGGAIIDNLIVIQTNIKSTMSNLLLQAFYYPVMFASWSVVIGDIIITQTDVNGEKHDRSTTSVYLLLILVIALYMLTMFFTSFNYFDIVLKLVSLIVSLTIAMRIRNTVLNNTFAI